jgi:methionine sulfoxide reductase heme-binding subunit
MKNAVRTMEKKALPVMLVMLVLLVLGSSLSMALPDSSTRVQGKDCGMGHYFDYNYDFTYDRQMTVGQAYNLDASFMISGSRITDNPYLVDVSVSGDGFQISENQFSLADGSKTIQITPTKAGAKLSITTRLVLDGDTGQHPGYQGIYYDTFTLNDFSIIDKTPVVVPVKNTSTPAKNTTQAPVGGNSSTTKISDDKTINITTSQNGNKTNTSVAVTRNEPSKIPWYIVRITGMVAFVMLSLSVMIGLLRKLNPKKYGKLYSVHCDISYLAIIFAFMHGINNLLDRYMWMLGLKNIFWFSFISKAHTFISLGVIAFYLMLIVTITSLSPKIMVFMKRKNWYAVHLSSYLAYAFVVAHSLFLGTDLNVAKLDNPISIISFAVFAGMLALNAALLLALWLKNRDDQSRKADGKGGEAAGSEASGAQK